MVIINPVHLRKSSASNERQSRYSSIQNNVSRVQHEIHEQFRLCDRSQDIVERKAKRNQNQILKSLKARHKRNDSIPFSGPRSERRPGKASLLPGAASTADLDLLDSSTASRKSHDATQHMHDPHHHYNIPLSKRFPNTKFHDFDSFHHIMQDMDPHSPYFHEIQLLLESDDVQHEIAKEARLREREIKEREQREAALRAAASSEPSKQRMSLLTNKLRKHTKATQNMLKSAHLATHIHQQRVLEREESSITYQVKNRLWSNPQFREHYQSHIPNPEIQKKASRDQYLDELMGMPQHANEVPALDLDSIHTPSPAVHEDPFTSSPQNSTRPPHTEHTPRSKPPPTSDSRSARAKHASGKHTSRRQSTTSGRKHTTSARKLNSSRSTSTTHRMNLNNPTEALDDYMLLSHGSARRRTSMAEEKPEHAYRVLDEQSPLDGGKEEVHDLYSSSDAEDAGASDGRLWRREFVDESQEALPALSSSRKKRMEQESGMSGMKRRKRKKRGKVRKSKKDAGARKEQEELDAEEQRHLNLLSVASGVEAGMDLEELQGIDSF